MTCKEKMFIAVAKLATNRRMEDAVEYRKSVREAFNEALKIGNLRDMDVMFKLMEQYAISMEDAINNN